MADHTTDRTTTYVEREAPRSGGGAMGFILGAVVVVLAILAFVVFGGDADTTADTSAPAAAESSTDSTASATVTITDESAGASAAATDSDGDAAAAEETAPATADQ